MLARVSYKTYNNRKILSHIHNTLLHYKYLQQKQQAISKGEVFFYTVNFILKIKPQKRFVAIIYGVGEGYPNFIGFGFKVKTMFHLTFA